MWQPVPADICARIVPDGHTHFMLQLVGLLLAAFSETVPSSPIPEHVFARWLQQGDSQVLCHAGSQATPFRLHLHLHLQSFMCAIHDCL